MPDPTAVLDETRLTAAEAAAVCRTSARTVIRWAADGFPLPGGGVVRLDAVRVGRQWVTSREAVARFAALTTTPAPAPVAPTPVKKTSRRSLDTLKRHGVSA